MACMDHECKNCGHAVMNNSPGPGGPCEKCGCEDFLSIYDEAPTRFDEPDEREDEYDEYDE